MWFVRYELKKKTSGEGRTIVIKYQINKFSLTNLKWLFSLQLKTFSYPNTYTIKLYHTIITNKSGQCLLS